MSGEDRAVLEEWGGGWRVKEKAGSGRRDAGAKRGKKTQSHVRKKKSEQGKGNGGKLC